MAQSQLCRNLVTTPTPPPQKAPRDRGPCPISVVLTLYISANHSPQRFVKTGLVLASPTSLLLLLPSLIVLA